VNEQGVAACVSVKVWPAIVIVPLRDVVPGFAVTSYETVPFPLPLAPAVTVIHATLLTAVHVHPVPTETLTVPDAAAAVVRFAESGETRKLQGRPTWVIVNVCPPMVSVPVRAGPVLAVTP